MEHDGTQPVTSSLTGYHHRKRILRKGATYCQLVHSGRAADQWRKVGEWGEDIYHEGWGLWQDTCHTGAIGS